MSFISGLIFSMGLVIAGMTNPDKVIGFLNIFREWDYALAFVMAGAVLFNLVTFKFIKRSQSPLFADKFEWPTKKDIDKRLVTGSIMFGIGWGIGGVCPGPAVANLVLFDPKIVVFVVSMLVGMFLFKKTQA